MPSDRMNYTISRRADTSERRNGGEWRRPGKRIHGRNAAIDLPVIEVLGIKPFAQSLFGRSQDEGIKLPTFPLSQQSANAQVF